MPVPLKIILWADFAIFLFFALANYFGNFKPENEMLASNPIARTALWNSDMVNGCGGIICMWIFGGSLWVNAISVTDVETLFISHAVWYGQLIAMMPPHPAVTAVLLSNPHTYLYFGTVVTGWHLVRWPCLVVSPGLLAFALYRRWYQIPRVVYNKDQITFRDTLDAIAAYDPVGAVALEGCVQGLVPCATIPPPTPEIYRHSTPQREPYTPEIYRHSVPQREDETSAASLV